MTERLPFHFSLSCTGEGNGNPLQCSCLENPRDGRAWWAAVHGVTQSRTRLKWLSSSILLVPCTLPRPLVKSLMPRATMVPGPGGRFQSVFPILMWRPSDLESELQMHRTGKGPEKCSAQFSSFTDEANPSTEETRNNLEKKPELEPRLFVYSTNTHWMYCAQHSSKHQVSCRELTWMRVPILRCLVLFPIA